MMQYSSLAEGELLDLLTHALKGSSQDHKYKRIAGLEEMQKRIRSNHIQNVNGAVDMLLEMAVAQGDTKPESSLIVDSLSLLINKNDDLFKRVLNGLKRHEGQLFIVFANLTLKLDHKKKKVAIKPLLNFIVSRDNITSMGVNEVYSCLASLGNQRLSKDIVKESSQHLDSFEICAILFSVRLCSEFADQSLLPQMLKVLDRSMTGYYNAHHVEIERRLCEYLKRIKDPNSFPNLVKLLKLRYRENPSDISDTLCEILNSHPHLMDNLLDTLYDTRHNKDLVNAILRALEKMKRPPSAKILLPRIYIKYWWESPASYYVKSILVKGGESSKRVLFNLLRDKEKYDFALECLKEIGISTEELKNLFPKPPLLQVYNFFYSHAQRGKKMPEDLNTLWIEKEELGKNVPGTTNRLEHLLLHILSAFNFVTLNVAPLKLESVDIIGFHPETLDLLVIGCTTGVIKDDLAKMDALINKMETKMPDLFSKCSVTPVIACSKSAAISPSDAKYSYEQGIAILQDYDIDKLLEMLDTNRESKQVLRYIEECKLRHVDTPVGY